MSHCGPPRSGRTLRDVTRILAIALLVFALSAGAAQAHDGGGGDVNAAGVCGQGATASLSLRADDGRIELRFRLRQRSGRGVWRIAIVHEQRVSSRATKRTTRGDDSFELRRRLVDLRGSDSVTVHAWGPGGLGCRAAATLDA
jgi:hypothetical protein